MVSAICPATVAGDARVVPGLGGDRCGLRSASESVFHSVLLLRPEWVGEPGFRWVWRYWTFRRTPRLIQVWACHQTIFRGMAGEMAACSRYVRMSQRPDQRGGAGVWRCTRRTRRPGPVRVLGATGEGVRRSVADGAGDGQGQEERPRVRAYGALARDAPSLPGGPPARRGPCLRRDHGRALVRRRDARSRSPVPSRQRSPPHAETPRRSRRPLQDCQCREPE